MKTDQMSAEKAREYFWSGEYHDFTTLHQCDKCFSWFRAEIPTKTVWKKVVHNGVEATFPEKVIIPRYCDGCLNPSRTKRKMGIE